MATPVRLVIVTDRQLVREGLTALLAGQRRRVHVVAAERGTGADTGAVDVILYDALSSAGCQPGELPVLTPIPRSRVVALVPDLRPDIVAAAAAHGVVSCVPMSATAEALADAVVAAHLGVDDSAPSTGQALAGGDCGLSTRELEVLTLIAQGCSNAQIAGLLFLSVNSIKTYIRTAYRKIGVTRRSQAVLWCIRHGLGPLMDSPAPAPDESADRLSTPGSQIA